MAESKIKCYASRIVVESEIKNLGFAFGANSGRWVTTSISKSGYRPIGIVGIGLSMFHEMYIQDFNVYLTENDGYQARAYVYNPTAGNITPTSITFYVLWEKE